MDRLDDLRGEYTTIAARWIEELDRLSKAVFDEDTQAAINREDDAYEKMQDEIVQSRYCPSSETSVNTFKDGSRMVYIAGEGRIELEPTRTWKMKAGK
jgi:hypothetical protein